MIGTGSESQEVGRRIRRVLRRACIPAAVALAVGAGCTRSAGDGATPAKSARRYTVRAEVVGLPPPGARVRELTLRHEPIDDFVDQSGQVVGMDSMVMPFRVSPELSLAGIAAGDEVEAVFAVDWSSPSLRIERLAKLPAGTALHFGRARPADAGGAAGR